jgi:voltage-gated potassium channel
MEKITAEQAAESDRISREADIVFSMRPADMRGAWINRFLRILIWVSIGSYLIELMTGSSDSRSGNLTFLWLERVVAGIFTIEYLTRWVISFREDLGYERTLFRRVIDYPTSALGLIDLIAIVPFWVGFFVPAAWLGLIRSLRVLRLLKYFRYSRSLQLVALAWFRAWNQLKALGFAMLVFGLFCMIAIYEAEKVAQPEAFDGLFNTLWFTTVTVTTVGYGDMSPVTQTGKILAMMTFLPSLAVFAALIGIMGNSFSTVLEEELDPDVDPIAKFVEAREEQRRIKRMNQEFHP